MNHMLRVGCLWTTGLITPVLAIFGAAGQVPKTSAPAADDDIAAKVKAIDQVIEAYAELGQLSGSVLVSLDGEVIYRRGVGLANREWNIPNGPDTKHRIASHGKAFTAAIILQLVDEGRLELHGPISTYLPEYRKDIADRITAHQLLAHSSGAARIVPEWGDYRDPFTLDKTIALANKLELEQSRASGSPIPTSGTIC